MVTWAAGAVVNVVGSLCINLGQNLMSAGHRARSASNATGKELPSIRKYRKWQIGVTIFAVGNVCNFGSFALAAQSLLAALGSVQFIANIIFGRIVLKEKVTKQVLLATALIVAGCVILVSFGNHTSDVYTSAELQSYYRKTPYIIYMASMVAGVVVSYLIFRHGNKQRIHRKQTMTNVSPFWRRVLPLTYCTFAGLVGTQSVLFCKTLSSLLRTSISGKSQFGSWFLYLNLFLFIIVAAFWVQRLNTGLLLFPTVVIVPLLQISWTLFSIFTGLVYFSEYKTFTTLKAAMFGLGVTVVVLGIMVLTHSRSDPYADVEAEELNQEKSLSRTTSGQSHSSTLIRDGSGQDDLGEALQKVSISSAGSHSSNISRKTSEPASPRPSKGPRLLPQPLDTSFFQDVVADFSLSLKSTGRQIIGLGGDKPVSIFSMPMTDIHPPNQSEASPLRLTPIHDIEMQGTLPNPEPSVETLPMSTPPKPAPRFRIRNPFAGGGLGSDGETDDDSPVAEPAARSPFDAPDRDERKFSSPNPAMSPAGREGIATRRTAMVQLGADDNPMSPTWDEPHDSARVQLSPQGGSNALFGGLLSPRALLSRRQGYAELEEQNTDARKDP